MATPPLRTALADTYPNPSNATMRAGMGALWDYVTTLLGATGTPADARAALGFGGGQLSGMRNKIINGGMHVAQRGNVDFTSANNLYGGCDRMLTSINGTTVSAVVLQAAAAWSESGMSHQVGNVVTTGATLVQVSQRIEALNTRPLNGKTVTFSGKVLQISGGAQTLNIVLNKATSLDTYAAGGTLLASTPLSIPNNTVTPFSFTLALGSVDAENGLAAILQYATLAAQSASQFYFADLQLEVGSVVTPFEHRLYGIELALCQRYYERSANLSGVVGARTLIANHATSVAGFYFQVPKRAVPTVIFYSRNGTSGKISSAHTGLDITGTATAPDISNSAAYMIMDSAASLVVGHAYEANYTASAEL